MIKQLVVILFLLAYFAPAQGGANQTQADAEDMANALAALTQLGSFVDANVEFCRNDAPNTLPAVTQAAEA